MNAEKLRLLLDGLGINVIAKEETGSTSSDARKFADTNPSSPALFVADRQTGGRGRQGKSFISPEGGLYMSLLLPTNMPITQAMSATSCAAVAVRRAILSASGADCGIKWINDLYLSGGKLCGILAESVNDYETMTSRYLIIGVGINMTTAPELNNASTRAVSLWGCGYGASKEELCAKAVREIMNTYRSGFDFSLYSDEYKKNSILLGKEITFTRNGETEYGVAEDITDRGTLTVKCKDKTVILDSGEVTVRMTKGNT